MRWRLADDRLKPLTAQEAFYLGTKGGGAFFGKVGSFETGYELDAVVLNDESLRHPQPLDVKDSVCCEIDTPEDLENVKNMLKDMRK